MDYARKYRTAPRVTWDINIRQQGKVKATLSRPLRRPFEKAAPCIPKGDEPAEEDPRLLNWKHWLKDRHKRQEVISKTVLRAPLDLLLNSHDCIRTKKEDQELMEQANRSEVTNQDKDRGNPAFWCCPDLMREAHTDEDLAYAARMCRARRNMPPLMERVALSDMIIKEKNLIREHVNPANVNLQTNWHNSKYFRKRAEELRKEMEFIEPKRPQMRELVVVGKNFGAGDNEPAPIRTPVISISRDERSPGPEYLQHPDDRISLKIEDREFVLEHGHHFEKLSEEKSRAILEKQRCKLSSRKEGYPPPPLDPNKYAFALFETNRVYRIFNKKPAKTLDYSLCFESCRNELDRRIITFENKGSRIIKIEWREETPKFETKMTSSMTYRVNDSGFSFDKNGLKILPGQRCEFSIWFRSDLPRVASETWKINLYPKVYPGPIYLRLWGIAHAEPWKLCRQRERKEIKEHIKCMVVQSTIRSVVQEIINNAVSEKMVYDVPYKLFFLEADVFRARNPRHHYRSDLVQELRDMWVGVVSAYNEGKEDVEEVDENCWDMSLKNMRCTLLRKLCVPEERREKLERFHGICHQLLRPMYCYDRPACPKYRMARFLFGIWFNQFEDESELVWCRCLGVRCPPPEPDGEAPAPEEGTTVVEVPVVQPRVEEESRASSVSSGVPTAPQVYNEVFYVRMYCLLCETIDRISDSLESYDYFIKEDI